MATSESNLPQNSQNSDPKPIPTTKPKLPEKIEPEIKEQPLNSEPAQPTDTPLQVDFKDSKECIFRF